MATTPLEIAEALHVERLFLVSISNWHVWKPRLTIVPHSDGIARVHGMANVQAEELVEYVFPATLSPANNPC